jgi:hypothetical protein
METCLPFRLHRIGWLFAAMAFVPALSSAQVTPAAGYTPPDDTPSIRIGATIFTNYTYQTRPDITDADGNVVDRSAFDVGRAYLNITGNISHVVAFRITPDITRETSPTPSLNGSLVFRIKYAFAQFNLDDWMTRGSWARVGIQQTPWVDFEEGIYRYRFQGTVFAERVPLPTSLSSSDAGASFHYNLPKNYGDFHVGVYNGENYGKPEVNDQKAFQFRGTVRPLATRAPVLRGLRAHLFWDSDHYVKNGDRRRLLGGLTYEHPMLNAGFDYLDAHDRALTTLTDIHAKGYSAWATPRLPKANGSSWEALLRYDHWTPNSAGALAPAATSPSPGSILLDDQKQNRTIVGVSYWFPHQGGVSTAILLDYDRQKLSNITTDGVRSVAVHALINF